MLRAARSKVANWRGGIIRPVTHRGGGAPTRAVVMGRSEPLAGVWGGAHDWRGLVRVQTSAACRRAFRDASGLLWIGWGASTLSRGLSQAVRNVVGRRQMR